MKPKKTSVFLDRRKPSGLSAEGVPFQGDSVLVRREGNAVILEPAQDWPEGFVESFAGVTEEFERPQQGAIDKRQKLGLRLVE